MRSRWARVQRRYAAGVEAYLEEFTRLFDGADARARAVRLFSGVGLDSTATVVGR